jgi:hypothetical protein
MKTAFLIICLVGQLFSGVKMALPNGQNVILFNVIRSTLNYNKEIIIFLI